nr:adenylate/guanylate cyclase domain-containing protein [uncultured Dongia sp.]
MTTSLERKLTNILSADVYGYSRLMGQDEPGTLALLNTYRDAMAGAIATHRGRIVSAAGDHVLAEFASVVLAVECAVAIQRDLAERNATLSAERQMWFRIGLNLGDVIVEKDDLYGEGVNIAARLQALAEPGGILISGTVFDHVKDKLALGFDALGPQRLKNIAGDVAAYRVLLQSGTAAAPAPRPAESADTGKIDTRKHRFYVSAARTAAIVVFLLAINLFSYAGDLWFQWPALVIVFVFVLRTTWIFRH